MPPSLNIILLNVQENPHLHILELLLYMSNSMLTHQFPPTQALSSFFTVIAYTQIITLKLMFFPPPFFVCFLHSYRNRNFIIGVSLDTNQRSQ